MSANPLLENIGVSELETSSERVYEVTRPQRWDEPFGARMSDESIDSVLAIAPFCDVDQSRFPQNASLHDILRNDARVRTFQTGDIVVRQGDYGNSAFFVLSGKARVAISGETQGIPEKLFGRAPRERRGWYKTFRSWLQRDLIPEARDLRGRAIEEALGARRCGTDEVRMFLQDLSAVVARHPTVALGAGEAFGEIAALSRTPRTATVFADGPLEAVEIRWQGLRDLRNRSPEVKEHFDRRYRERSLRAHLAETPLLAHLTPEELQRVAEQTEFETHGSFNWASSYKTLKGRAPIQRIEGEPVIVEEGDYVNGLLLVRSGFARASERYGHGHRTVRYLGCGEMFGFHELYENWTQGKQVPFAHTLRAIGYIDLLVIPTPVVESFIFSNLDAEVLEMTEGARRSPVAEKKRRPRRRPKGAGNPLAEAIAGAENSPDVDALGAGRTSFVVDEFLERLVDDRLINGTASMMIDLDRCTRCDDCVRACAGAHGGNPRFIRHGREIGSYMIANACMHCSDPVCMIGCPTGAIHRDPDGQVVIDDDQCIGCSGCANSCPYDNIRMVEIRDRRGAQVLDDLTREPIRRATKCDLCAGQLVSPACERACPHDALRRIDLGDIDAVRAWVGR